MWIAFALTVLAALLWIVALPLLTLRAALVSPDLYRRALRESDLFTHLAAQLSYDLPRAIPAAEWSPWAPRSPESLRAVLAYALEATAAESLVVDAARSWAQWARGDALAPAPLTPALAASLTGPAGDHIRDFLWQSLPACQSDETAHCLPADTGAWPALGPQQRAWWARFVAETTVWLQAEEARCLAALPVLPAWGRMVTGSALLALLCTLSGALLLRGRERWLCPTLPLIGGGLFAAATGLATWGGLFAPPVLPAEVGALWDNVAAALLPQLWPPLTRLLGATLTLAGAASLGAGLLGLLLIVAGWRARVGVLAGLLLTLGGATAFYPQTILPPVLPPDFPLLGPTATPWPTLTATPTATPTPTITPTPTVIYWPVAPGTPLPTPAAPLAASPPARVGCYRDGPAPIAALTVTGGEIYAVQSDQTSRRALADLAPVAVTRHPVAATQIALAASGQQAALAQGRNVYFYNLPGWTRALSSRVATFSSARALTYVTGRDQLAVGLENGYVWVMRPTTGGIVWLLPAHGAPVTALAAHPQQPYVLSGAQNGELRLWDMDAGREVTPTLQGSPAAIVALAFSPDGAQALSADAEGTLSWWDVAERRLIHRHTLSDYALTTLLWTEQGLLAGTGAGVVLRFSPTWDFAVWPGMDAAITTLTWAEPGYLLAGSATGEVCVWARLIP